MRRNLIQFGLGVFMAAILAVVAGAQAPPPQNDLLPETPQPSPPPQPVMPPPPEPSLPPPPSAMLPAPPEQSLPVSPPAVMPAEQLAPAELTGLLGHAVLAAQAADLGHIVDLLVDGQGRVRAVVVDVGGFMGVGNRKVAVTWSALRFAAGEKGPVISIQIPIDRIKSWAEYIAGRPVAVLGTPDTGP